MNSSSAPRVVICLSTERHREIVREYVNETFVKPGIASFEDIVGGSHCMTPAYLQNQLDQSLQKHGAGVCRCLLHSQS